MFDVIHYVNKSMQIMLLSNVISYTSREQVLVMNTLENPIYMGKSGVYEVDNIFLI